MKFSCGSNKITMDEITLAGVLLRIYWYYWPLGIQWQTLVVVLETGSFIQAKIYFYLIFWEPDVTECHCCHSSFWFIRNIKGYMSTLTFELSSPNPTVHKSSAIIYYSMAAFLFVKCKLEDLRLSARLFSISSQICLDIIT